MIKFYVGRIKRGEITIDDVPSKWRTKVEEALKEA
jgi:hypothetical protein